MWRFGHVLIVLTCALATRPGRAGVVNGGFEQALASWSTLGDADTAGRTFGSPPPAGEYTARLQTATSRSAPAIELEAFLGLAPGELEAAGLGNVSGGSAIRQRVEVSGGDVLSFSYNFASQPFGGIDFAFILIEQELIVLATRLDVVTAWELTDFRETGYRSFEHTFENGGSFDLRFGIVDVGSELHPSHLYVDQVTIVPEPRVLALLGVAILFGVTDRKPLRKA